MAALVIVGLIAGIGSVGYVRTLEEARYTQAVTDLTSIAQELRAYEIATRDLPSSLSELGVDLTDPWGHPYEYSNFDDIPKGKRRKDKFLTPLNSDFDLFSAGPDGGYQAPLTAKASQDDVIYAGDGAYIGPADEF